MGKKTSNTHCNEFLVSYTPPPPAFSPSLALSAYDVNIILSLTRRPALPPSFIVPKHPKTSVHVEESGAIQRSPLAKSPRSLPLEPVHKPQRLPLSPSYSLNNQTTPTALQTPPLLQFSRLLPLLVRHRATITSASSDAQTPNHRQLAHRVPHRALLLNVQLCIFR